MPPPQEGEILTGTPFTPFASVLDVTHDANAAVKGNSCAIDLSHVSQGYASATGTSTSRLKLQVVNGDRSYNYDMSTDGSPVFVPLNMGNGAYKFRVMQNTSGSNYIELFSASANVNLESEFSPFLRPNVFCDFDDNSAATKLARKLTANDTTQEEILRTICTWIANNVSYDNAKAQRLSNTTGYVPNPDSTLSSRTGICFDYASLGAAMLRSLGIPTQVVTGYVSPKGLYHAWIMVYIDGIWQSAEFKVNPHDWSRVDLTFAATSNNEYVGNGTEYEDRYVY